MYRLSDTVERKFIDSIDLGDEWEIETDTGWEQITHIHQTVEYDEWHLILKDDYELICADDHIVFDENFKEVFVKDLSIGSYVMTKSGAKRVISAAKLQKSSNMYDLTVNSENHRFYTNGILSHNTTTAVAVILHYILFNEYKTVAILANKGDSAREVLGRVQLAYEALPKWLQQGVEEWNKGNIALENGCKIYAGTTSSSAIRGKSVSFLYLDECVGGDTKVCVELCGDHYYYGEISSFINVDERKFIEVEDNTSTLYTVYRTVNKISNEEYIGFHKVKSESEILCNISLSGSIYKDGYLGSGKLIKRAIEKYKPANMRQELLCVTNDINEAKLVEQTLVDLDYTKREDTYNSTIGGRVKKIMRILGKNKFENFDGFYEVGLRECVNVVLDNHDTITCSRDHGMLLSDGTWILAKELIAGDILSNNTRVVNIQDAGALTVYSAKNVGSDFSYYTNGIISHNCAFIEGYDEFFASVYPTISSGEETKLLMTSTPNGLNHFWKTCKGAEEGKNGYEFVKVMWYDVPGRGEKWKQETLEALDFDEEKFKQEYCCSFLGSSGTLISGSKLKELDDTKPIYESDGIRQYERPVPGHVYVMTVDVSRGKGLDYSTFTIFDCTKMPYKQVCTFRDNMIGPVDFAAIIFRMGKFYNEASVLVEINDVGSQVSDTLLMDYGYENILFTENAGRSGKRISTGFGGRSSDPGIRTTKTVKAVGCSMLKLLVEQNQLLILDANTISEIKRFSRKGNSYEAESGAHDDMVMNLVIFAWLTDQTYFKDITDINTLSRLREKTEEQIEEDLLPFGFIDTGDEIDEQRPGFQPVRSWL